MLFEHFFVLKITYLRKKHNRVSFKMIKPSIFHSHCSFCDGHASAEEFVKEAIREGFASYGFSSHAPLPFETRWTIKKERVVDYLHEINRLKAKYAQQIEIYVGLEIDYLTDSHHPMIDYFRQLPLDYRIASVHLLENQQGELFDIDVPSEIFKQLICDHFHNDLEYAIQAYYAKQTKSVITGGFDIIGHVDKISRNANYCEPGVTESAWYRKLVTDLLIMISKKPIIVEINTKAYLESGYFYPNEYLFPLLKELNIPVHVNSDAHFPEKINDGRAEALNALQKVGIHSLRELHNNSWQEISF